MESPSGSTFNSSGHNYSSRFNIPYVNQFESGRMTTTAQMYRYCASPYLIIFGVTLGNASNKSQFIMQVGIKHFKYLTSKVPHLQGRE